MAYVTPTMYVGGHPDDDRVTPVSDAAETVDTVEGGGIAVLPAGSWNHAGHALHMLGADDEHINRRLTYARSGEPISKVGLIHLALPEDSNEAHSLIAGLMGSSYKTGAVKRYDTNRFMDLIHSKDPDGVGFSNHPTRGSVPPSGFMVSASDEQGKGYARVHPISGLRPTHLAEHRQAISKQLRKHGNYQGAWLDRSDGNVYLDLSHHEHDEDKARSYGLQHKQKAYYDLGHGTERYFDTEQDPLHDTDRKGWSSKYADVHAKYGTHPPEQYQTYRHLYDTPAEKTAKAARLARYAQVEVDREEARARFPR
jgi:hypothetical protein